MLGGGVTLNKKAFTLIELLSVIVILAIISLIATPIILNIISDAREESNKRSVELYASAVKNAVATEQLKGNIVTSIGDIDMNKYYDGDVVCEIVIIGKNNNVYLEDCIVNGNKLDYTYGSHFNTVCMPVETSTTGNVPKGDYVRGDEYTCEVKEGTYYTFFILSKEGNKVNLIMDSNVRKDGTPVKEENPTDKGLVAWISKSDYIEAGGTEEEYGNLGNNNKGPLTAMKYLQSATSSWTNLEEMQISTFKYNNGMIKEMTTFTTYARMPDKSELFYTEWLTNYMSYSSSYPNRTVVSGVGGYWISSARFDSSCNAYSVDRRGLFNNCPASYKNSYGVRPVITLSI